MTYAQKILLGRLKEIQEIMIHARKCGISRKNSIEWPILEQKKKDIEMALHVLALQPKNHVATKFLKQQA